MSLRLSKRAVSPLISGIFVVAVSVMIFGTLTWQFYQADAYNRITLERFQREAERNNEKVLIVGAPANISYLKFNVTNYGSVPCHIVDLFMKFSNGTLQLYTVDEWLIPGSVKQIVLPNIRLSPNDKFDLQLATERGNLFGSLPPWPTPGNYYYNNGSYYYYNAPPGPSGIQPVPFTFSFAPDDYQYNTVSNPNDPNWKRAWIFTAPSGNIYFRVKMKNFAGGPVVVETRSHINFVITSGASAMQSKGNSALLTELTLQQGGEGWLLYAPIDRNKFDQGTFQYYAFVAVFYHYVGAPSVTLGTTVAILASEITR